MEGLLWLLGVGLLLIALPGFERLTWRGFATGLVKSFLYGALAGLACVPIHNALERRFGG
jgi:hypothetical protein